jgi:acyl carrier protein
METKTQIDPETVERELIAAIRVCMEAGGMECPPLTPDTVPLKDLKGFDSLCAIEVVVDLEEKLGEQLGEDLFSTGSGKATRLRNVREITKKILEGGKSSKKGREKDV